MEFGPCVTARKESGYCFHLALFNHPNKQLDCSPKVPTRLGTFLRGQQGRQYIRKRSHSKHKKKVTEIGPAGTVFILHLVSYAALPDVIRGEKKRKMVVGSERYILIRNVPAAAADLFHFRTTHKV